MRADFQQYYGLNIDDIGDAYSVYHASVLSSQLPSDSRTYVAEDPAAAWGLSDYILARIEYNTHVSWYAKTKDAKAKRNAPELITPDEKKRKKQGISFTQEQVDEILSRPRKGVPLNGN